MAEMNNSYFFRTCGQLLDASCENKEARAQDYVRYMLNRTQSIFRYDGLPDTIPQEFLELYLQSNGFAIIAERDNNLYAFFGGLGGEQDEYYRPTIATVANPYLKFSKEFRIGEDCEIIKNDTLLMGMMPMYSKYARQLAENELTIKIADVNCRIQSLISADDDRTKKSAEEYLKKVEEGKLGVIAENAFLEGLKTQPYASSGYSNVITQLIELQQYLKASWYNDIGLQSNYNMKRESINSNEAQLNEESLLPLIDNMLYCRREGLDRVNTKYGLNISVELSSAWNEQRNDSESLNEDGIENDMKGDEEIEDNRPES